MDVVESWGQHQRVTVGACPDAAGALQAECSACNITLISDVAAGDLAEFEARTLEQMREQYTTGFGCFIRGGVRSVYYGLPLAVWPTGSCLDHRQDYLHLNAAEDVTAGRITRKCGERLCTRGRFIRSSSPGRRWVSARSSFNHPFCPHCLRVLARLGASEFLIRALDTPLPESEADEGDETF